MADKAGIPRNNLSRYIKGRDIKASVLVRIANTLGVSVEWLATGEGPREVKTEFNEDLATLILLLLWDVEWSLYGSRNQPAPREQHAQAFVSLYREAIRHPPEKWASAVQAGLQAMIPGGD